MRVSAAGYEIEVRIAYLATPRPFPDRNVYPIPAVSCSAGSIFLDTQGGYEVMISELWWAQSTQRSDRPMCFFNTQPDLQSKKTTLLSSVFAKLHTSPGATRGAVRAAVARSAVGEGASSWRGRARQTNLRESARNTNLKTNSSSPFDPLQEALEAGVHVRFVPARLNFVHVQREPWIRVRGSRIHGITR